MSIALESRGLGMQHILIIEKDMERVPIDVLSSALSKSEAIWLVINTLHQWGKLSKSNLLWTKVSCSLFHNLVFLLVRL